LCLLVVAGYAGSLLGDFVWDDRLLIVENDRVRQADRLGELLTSSFWETGDRYDRFRSFFRPLVSLSFFVDHALWGLRPWGFHLTNLLLHMACSVLVLAVARREGLPPWSAFAAGALFAVHPVHVESVAWISGRTDVLCVTLCLGAFLLHRRATDPGRAAGLALAGSALLFGLALAAKEMAATLPFLLALDRWFERRRPANAVRAAWPHFVVLAVYAAARQATLGAAGEPLFTLEPSAWVATALFVVARYLTLLLLPIGLDAHYPYAPLDSLATAAGVVAAAFGGVVACAAWALARHSPRGLFWLAWTVLALVPVLAFGRFGDVIMADRFLYLPSVGWVLLAAHGLAGLARGRSRVFVHRTAAVTAAAIVALTVATAARTRVWTNDLTLFADMVRTSPDSALVRCNLGMALHARGEIDAAVLEHLRAIELEPSYAMAYNNLAVALEAQGRFEEALGAYREALALAPAQLEASINFGHLLSRTGSPERGLALLQEVVGRHPRHAAARYALADALERQGRGEEALGHLAAARRLRPEYANVYYLTGKIRFDRGQLEQAATEMRTFLALWPEAQDPWARAARQVIRRAESE
jgi:tetratricopeptide (TPR) repeat protein